MGRQVLTDQQAGFASGVNITTDQAFLRPDQARDMTNYRLSAFGAALKRLGTQLTTASPISTFSATNYGGIYWPSRAQIFAIGAASGSTAETLYETTYPASMPATWSSIGTVTQYRPVIFTDGTYPEVMYLAGDNANLVQKVAPSLASITVDSRNAGTSATPASSLTWNHTMGSGSNRLLVVFLTTNGVTGTTVKWDTIGVNLSFTKLSSYAANSRVVEIWYLVAPTASVTKAISVTFSGSGNVAGASASYFNVNQTTPFESTSPRTASGLIGTQPMVIVPSMSTDKIVDVVADSVAETPSLGAGQTSIAATNLITASDAAGAVTEVTMSRTGTTGNWIQMGAAMVAATNSPDLTISTLLTGTASVSGLVVFNDRLWGWNTFGQSNALFYSELSTTIGSTGGDSLGNASAGGGEIIVTTFGIAAIVACAAVGGSLLIFHQRGISRLTGFGQDDITVVPQALTADVGMSNATQSGLIVYDNIAYFVSDRGIYRANESSVSALSTPDKPDPTAALLQAGSVQPSQFVLSFNRPYNELWVSINGVGIYVYNTILESWSGPFTGTYASGTKAIIEVVDSSTGTYHLWRLTYASSAFNVSECDRLNVYKDDLTSAGSGGSTVTGTLQLHRLFCQDRVLAKTFRWCNFIAQIPSGATPPIVECRTSLGGATTLTMGAGVSIQLPYYLSPGGLGAFLDVTITDQVSNGLTEWSLATVQANLLGQR